MLIASHNNTHIYCIQKFPISILFDRPQTIICSKYQSVVVYAYFRLLLYIICVYTNICAQDFTYTCTYTRVSF